MLAKITSRNQVTIPKKIMDQLPNPQYFDVELKDGLVVMKPLVVYDTDLEQIRGKMKQMGLKADSVKEAIHWARSR